MKIPIFLGLSHIGALLAPSFALAEFKYEVKVLQNGVEVAAEPRPLPASAHRHVANHGSRVRRASDAIDYSNWCGATQLSPSSGTFTSVVGIWSVPTVSLRSDETASENPELGQWVGIDGWTCATGLWQTGTASYIDDNGAQQNYAWYEWYPDLPYLFPVTVNAGDYIFGNVTLLTPTSGIAIIENASTGVTASVKVTGATSICGQNAEWILEDPGNPSVAFPKFSPVSFYWTYATTSTGALMDNTGATISWIPRNGVVACEASQADSATLNLVSEGS